MSIRRTMKARRALAAVAMTTGLVLTAAGCGGGGGDDQGDDRGSSASPDTRDDSGNGGGDEAAAGPDDQVLAQVKGSDDITLTITRAVRSEGGFLTVGGTVENGGSELFTADNWKGDETELAGNAISMAGATVIDQAEKKRYLILRDTEGRCLCTKFGLGVKAGESQEWFTQFPAPPSSTKKVDFQIADMPVATIEISDE